MNPIEATRLAKFWRAITGLRGSDTLNSESLLGAYVCVEEGRAPEWEFERGWTRWVIHAVAAAPGAGLFQAVSVFAPSGGLSVIEGYKGGPGGTLTGVWVLNDADGAYGQAGGPAGALYISETDTRVRKVGGLPGGIAPIQAFVGPGATAVPGGANQAMDLVPAGTLAGVLQTCAGAVLRQSPTTQAALNDKLLLITSAVNTALDVFVWGRTRALERGELGSKSV